MARNAGGMRGEALVLESVAALPELFVGSRIGGWSKWLAEVPLQVRLPGHEPFYASPKVWMGRAKYPIAGTIVPVTVDIKDSSAVSIEWDDVPKIDDWIADGHQVFTDPDSVEAALREVLKAHMAEVIDSTDRTAAAQAAAYLGPGVIVDSDAIRQAIQGTRATLPKREPLRRPPVKGPSGRILAVGRQDDEGAASRIYGEILLSVSIPGSARYGLRWKGFIPQSKLKPVWWDLPLDVDPRKPHKVKIRWDDVAGIEIATERMRAANDAFEARLTSGTALSGPAGLEAYAGILSAITDPTRRALVEQQLTQGLQYTPGAAVRPGSPAPSDPLDELKRLGERRAAGALSEAEFAAEKARLLGEM
jgi:putative oligomerization/nucleic acid binding protein